MPPPVSVGWGIRFAYPVGVVMSAALDAEVAKYTRDGYAVEMRTDTQAVVSKKAKIGWFWNTVLTLLTAGFWLIIVVYKLVNRKVERVTLTVDAEGKVRRS